MLKMIFVTLSYLLAVVSFGADWTDRHGVTWNCEWQDSQNWGDTRSKFPSTIRIMPQSCGENPARPEYRCRGPVVCSHTRRIKSSGASETFIQNFSPICALPRSNRCSELSASDCMRNAQRPSGEDGDAAWDKEQEDDFLVEYNRTKKLLSGKSSTSVNEASVIAAPRRFESRGSH